MSRLVSGGANVSAPATGGPLSGGLSISRESDAARWAADDSELPGLPPIAVSRGWGNMNWRGNR